MWRNPCTHAHRGLRDDSLGTCGGIRNIKGDERCNAFSDEAHAHFVQTRMESRVIWPSQRGSRWHSCSRVSPAERMMPL